MLDRLDTLRREHGELQSRLGDPELIADQVAYAEATRRYRRLDEIIECGDQIAARTDDAAAAGELLDVASPDERDQLLEERTSAEADVDRLTGELEVLLLPTDPNADRDVIVEIRGAEGGEEANLFARDLFEMYRTYASEQGWRFEVLDARRSDLDGFTDVTFQVSGDDVWDRWKFEGGPHRVQRVPVTESQGRVHTSSAAVTVMPLAEEVEVELAPADLDIETFRASGPGGQSVNTTDSAVRITHRPTGVQVSMQDQKSQLQNRNKAMTVLRSRILAAEQERVAAQQSEARRAQTGGGGRSEKVRTYNFKENRVTDHRIGLTVYQLDKVLGGSLELVVEPLLLSERTELLARSGA